MDFARLDKLIAEIYEGPLLQPAWQNLLELLRSELNAEVATLILKPSRDDANGVMHNVGGKSEHIDSYHQDYFALDPFVGLPAGQVVCLHEFIDREQLQASQFYRLSLAPSALEDILGADLKLEGEFDARLRIARDAQQGLFSSADKDLVAALLPHLLRAIRIHARLDCIESERALYAGAISQLALGSIILDQNAEVLTANNQAQQLLNSDAGIELKQRRLVLCDQQQQQALEQAIARVLAAQVQLDDEHSLVEALSLQGIKAGTALGLIVRAVPQTPWAKGPSTPSVALFISDPQVPSEAPEQAIQQLFGFTPTEARFALLLAKGDSLDEAAAAMGVSRNTARTHLRSAFAKTGVSRQTLLVRLILTSVAALADRA